MPDHSSPLLSSAKAFGLRIEQSLPPLNLFLLFEQLGFFSLGLFPIFVSDLSEYSPVGLGPLIFVLLELLLMLFNPFLDEFFSLFDQGLLKPFFELHVADFLLLLLF